MRLFCKITILFVAFVAFAGGAAPLFAQSWVSAPDIRGFSALPSAQLIDAAENNPLAAYALGMSFLGGKNADPKQALKWLQKAAYQEQPNAAFELARLMETGRGTGKDIGGALFWYNKAAERGVVEAMYALGRILSDSDESYVDLDGALAWHRKAAEKLYIPSHLALAAFRQTEKGSLISTEEAAAWLEKAANLGSDEATYQLAMLYLAIRGETAIGYGPSPQVRRAVFWLEIAAMRDYAPALHRLALFHLGGIDARLDVLKALDYLERAADRQYSPSLAMLGDIYAKGDLIPADPIRAFLYLSLAAEQGDKGAQTELAALIDIMAPNQQTAARRILRDWKAQR